MSTDKAENPSCVYGYTKRCAEIMIEGAGYKFYRSGNIFGSSGSVIQLFVNQIKLSNKITLTNGDMTRFFVPVDNVVSMLIGYVSEPPKAYRMRMVAKVAKELFGNDETVIEETGIRPGEKMHETLNGRNSEDCLGDKDELIKLFKKWKHDS